MKPHFSRYRGFTLIELMVTIAIVAILMVVAVPSLVTYQRNSEMTSFANALLASINAARGEAMKRGRYAMVVPADGVLWSSGWVVFVDVDGTRTYTAANDVLVLTKEAPPSYLTVSGNGVANEAAPYIMFDPSGYASKKSTSTVPNLTLTITRNDVSASEAAEQTRRLVIAVTGRARVCKPATDSTCGASATQ